MEFPIEPLIQAGVGGFMLNMMNLYQELCLHNIYNSF